MAKVRFSTTQLALDIPLRQHANLDNYISGRNCEAVRCVRLAAMHAGEHLVYLWGTADTGKTHLLQAACHEADHHGKRSVYLPVDQAAGWDPAIIDGLEGLALICFDNIEAIADKPQWQEALFYFLNRARDSGARVLVAGNAAPAALTLTLADLRSRLSAGLTFRLLPLTEKEKAQALHMRAHERGFDLSNEVTRYLLRHCRRDLSSLLALLDRLDRATIAMQRKVTIPFVRQFVEQEDDTGSRHPPG